MIQLPATNHAPSLMPDMTALLDVIFILLVFMMLTANVAPKMLELDLPQVAAPAKTVTPDAITLGLSESGDFSLDQQSYTDFDSFQQALMQRIQQARKQSNTPQLLVAADKDASLQPFVKLVAWLSEQGLSVAEVVVKDRSQQ